MKKGFMLIGLMVAMSATAAQQVSDPEEQSQVIKILNTMETDEAPAVRDSVAEPRIILVDQPAAAEPDAKENTFTVDAQVRARGEYNHGAIIPRELGDKAAIFVNNRARVSLGYERRNLQLRASVQHTGVWGQDDMKDRNGRVAMNEAWARANTNNGLFMQVGRQILSYDDERILGASDWNVAGNSHDALRLGWESPEHKVHVIGAFNQMSENNRDDLYYGGPMPYKNLIGAWYHYQARTQPVGVSVLGLNIAQERKKTETVDSRVEYMQVAGTHVTYSPMDFTFSASAYFEFGHTLEGRDISAYMASGRAQYNGDIVGGFLAYDYLSGNNGRNTNQHAFIPLYGTNHKFGGAMDFFTGTVHTGLQDAQAGVFVNLGRKRPELGRLVTISGTYHYFLTGEKYGPYEWGIGHEADFQVSCRLMRDLTITAGYSFMLGTETFEFLNGGNKDIWQDWGFLTINFTPRLFKLNW